MAQYQIILLPKRDYYTWVAAARDYVMRYHANLTSDPSVAGRHMYPHQVITVADAPQAYGRDISAWFRQHYPEARLDVVEASTPADLQNILASRLDFAASITGNDVIEEVLPFEMFGSAAVAYQVLPLA